jgi:hypothetical protein
MAKMRRGSSGKRPLGGDRLKRYYVQLVAGGSYGGTSIQILIKGKGRGLPITIWLSHDEAAQLCSDLVLAMRSGPAPENGKKQSSKSSIFDED